MENILQFIKSNALLLNEITYETSTVISLVSKIGKSVSNQNENRGYKKK